MVAPETMESSSGWAITPRVVVTDLALVVLVVAPTLGRPWTREGGSLEFADALAAALSIALVLARRRFPIPSLGAGIIAALAVTAIADRLTGLVLALIVLLFNVAIRVDRRTAVAAGGVTVLTMLGAIAIVAHSGLLGPESLAGLAWPMLAVAAADVLRSRRVALAAAEERVRRAEETRDEEARRRVIEERLRIARELHDVVAHRMAVVNVQAGVAAHLLRTQPDDAEQALAVVRSSARLVLDELSGILSVLRSPDDSDTPVEPAPTMEALPALVESFTAAGLDVRWTTSGEPRPMSESTQLAIYRTVQEALTNAHKHGEGTASLSIASTDRLLTICVTNRIAATSPRTSGSRPASTPDRSVSNRGYGLVGMRERVTAAGGNVNVAPNANGVFTVTVTFPVVPEVDRT